MVIFFLILSLILVAATVSFEIEPIMINWLDYHIELSVTLFVLSLLFSFFAFGYLTYFFVYLKNIPSSLKQYYSRKQDLENISLTIEGYSAMNRGDLDKMNWAIKRFNPNSEQGKLLNPLFLLLKAQYNHDMGNEEELENNYQELLQYKDLKIVALKGLINIRLNKKLYYDAIAYAEKAQKLQPKTDWLLKDLIEIYTELRQYDLAKQAIKQSMNYKFITKMQANALLVKIYIDLANQYIGNSEQSNAIDALKDALKIQPDNFEAVSILSRIYALDDNKKLAHKIIEKAWKEAPSLELARLMLHLYSDSSVEKRIKIVDSLIDSAPEAKISYLIMAELCIDEDMLPNARAAMDKLLAVYAPDSAMSKLMALIEAKSHNNHSIIINWLKKL